MEHRWSRREKILFNVILKCKGKDNFSGQTRDICQDGMFVRVERDLYRKGDIFDVEFFRNEKAESNHYFKKAWVVHCNNEGIGLMFIAASGQK